MWAAQLLCSLWEQVQVGEVWPPPYSFAPGYDGSRAQTGSPHADRCGLGKRPDKQAPNGMSVFIL